MKRLDTAGITDLQKVSSRALRLASMGRISVSDCSKITRKVDELSDLIRSIEEGEPNGEAC